MKTATSTLELLEPGNLKDALRMLREEGPLTPLAGCTDIYVSYNFGDLSTTRYINIWNFDELRKIEKKKTTLSIGALASYTQMIKNKDVRKWLPMLVDASREVGGIQIQNRGTLGGNIANGSPAGDTLPVLAAVDAVVVLRNIDGKRRVPFNEFYRGYRESVMNPDELIVAVEFPVVKGKQWFRKVGTRAAQAISKIVMAGVRDTKPRIALGSVAPTVIRLPKTEEALASGSSIEEAQEILKQEISPIDDIRSTEKYRRQVSANLLARFWKDTGRK